MTWKNITIGQYQKLDAIRLAEYEFEIERDIALLSVVSGIDAGELESYAKDKLIETAKVMDFTKEPISEKIVNTLKVKGRRFNIILQCEKLNAQQTILILKYCPDLKVAVENIHYLLATITNEVKWYLRKPIPFEEDFETKAQLFKDHVSIETVHAACVFFCKVYNSWLNATQTSLIQKALKIQSMAEKELKK